MSITPVSRLLLLAILLTLPTSLWAHLAGSTYTTIWLAQPGVKIKYTVPADSLAELERLPGARTRIQGPEYYRETVRQGFMVTSDHQPCTARVAAVNDLSRIGSYQYTLVFDCPTAPGRVSLDYRLFVDRWESHENFTDIHLAGLKQDDTLSFQNHRLEIPVTALLADWGRTLEADFPRDEATTPSVGRYLPLGIEHILLGPDHILFLLALLLIPLSLRTLIGMVTAFTLGHSVTLVMASLGWVSLDPQLIESVIALSIAYVAVANILWLQRNRQREADSRGQGRSLVAFGFGLMHGFGFSSMLREIGLPPDDLFSSLLLFNLGVEVGQLLLVALILPLLWAAWRRVPHQRVSAPASALVGLAGCYWLVERVFFW